MRVELFSNPINIEWMKTYVPLKTAVWVASFQPFQVLVRTAAGSHAATLWTSPYHPTPGTMICADF